MTLGQSMSQSNSATSRSCFAKSGGEIDRYGRLADAAFSAIDADAFSDRFERIGNALTFLELPPGLRQARFFGRSSFTRRGQRMVRAMVRIFG